MCWQPLQAMFVGVEEPVGIREGLPQVIQQLAQIGMGLRFSRIGPQEKSQMRAVLGCAPMQHKVGKQGLYTGNRDRCHRCLARYQQEVTQKMNVEGWNHHRPPFSNPGHLLNGVLHILFRSFLLCILAEVDLHGQRCILLIETACYHLTSRKMLCYYHCRCSILHDNTGCQWNVTERVPLMFCEEHGSWQTRQQPEQGEDKPSPLLRSAQAATSSIGGAMSCPRRLAQTREKVP